GRYSHSAAEVLTAIGPKVSIGRVVYRLEAGARPPVPAAPVAAARSRRRARYVAPGASSGPSPSAVRDLDDRPPDHQAPGVEVDVGPLDPAQLPTTRAGHCGEPHFKTELGLSACAARSM